MGKFFELKATIFIAIIFILATLMGLAAGIGLGSDAAGEVHKREIKSYELKLRESEEKRKQAEDVLKIMIYYHCYDLDIYYAIQDTFDPWLISLVIAVESEYVNDCISNKGCRGLMQLSPDKLDDWTNPRKNIRVGAAYLKEQLDFFGDLGLALAAYNAGPERVIRCGYRIPDIKETQDYIKKFRALGVPV